MNFESAIKRPFQDLKTFVIGIIISVIPIVNLLTFGFVLECSRRSLRGDNSLPKWENFGKLFVDGLKMIAVSLVYQIPTLVIAVIALGPTALAAIGGLASGNTSALTGAAGGLGVGLIVTLVAAVIFGLLAIAGILRMAVEGKFGAAFSFGEVRKKGLTRSMFFAYVAVIIVSLVISVLNVIPIVGTGASIFILAVFAYTLYAEAYRSASGAPAKIVGKPAVAKRKGKRK